MIYGSMDKEAGSTQATDFVKKKRSKISDFFPKLNSAVFKGYFGLSMLYLTYGEMRAYYYVCASHSKYMIIYFYFYLV